MSRFLASWELVGLASALLPIAFVTVVGDAHLISSVGGALALAMSALSIVFLGRTPRGARTRRVGIALLVAALGAWDLVRAARVVDDVSRSAGSDLAVRWRVGNRLGR
jgi:hypothetical protein